MYQIILDGTDTEFVLERWEYYKCCNDKGQVSILRRSRRFSVSYIKHGEYWVVRVILYTEIQNLMNVSEELRVIFEVYCRVSTKYTTWERLFALVSWVEWFCCTLAVEAADFIVALLSLRHTAQSFTPEYFNFQSTSFSLITAHFRQKNAVEAWKVKRKLKWFIECILSKHDKFNSQISYKFRPNMVIIRLDIGKKNLYTNVIVFRS